MVSKVSSTPVHPVQISDSDFISKGKQGERVIKDLVFKALGPNVPKEVHKQASSNLVQFLMQEEALLNPAIHTPMKKAVDLLSQQKDLELPEKAPTQFPFEVKDESGIKITITFDTKEGWKATLISSKEEQKIAISDPSSKGYSQLKEALVEKRLKMLLPLLGIKIPQLPSLEKSSSSCLLDVWTRGCGQFASSAFNFGETLPAEASTVVGGLPAWGIFPAALDLSKARRMYQHSTELQKKSEEMKALGKNDEAKVLKKSAKEMRLQAIGRIFSGTNSMIQSCLAAGQLLAEITQVSAVVEITGSIAGAACGPLLIVEGLRQTAVGAKNLFTKGEEKLRLEELKTLAREMQKREIMPEKTQLILDFCEMRDKWVKAKLIKHLLGTGGGAMLLTAGTVAIVSTAITAGPTLGISVAVAGGVAAGLFVTKKGYETYMKHSQRKEQKKLLKSHPELTDQGILARIYFAIKKEENEPGKQITTMLKDYYKVDPVTFVKLYEPIAVAFKEKYQISGT